MDPHTVYTINTEQISHKLAKTKRERKYCVFGVISDNNSAPSIQEFSSKKCALRIFVSPHVCALYIVHNQMTGGEHPGNSMAQKELNDTKKKYLYTHRTQRETDQKNRILKDMQRKQNITFYDHEDEKSTRRYKHKH